MTDENKPIQIEFAPGAFDHFEGTQEELDELIAEVQKMFEGKTREEIAAMSRPLDIDDIEDLPKETKEQLARIFLEDEDIPTEVKRNLQ
jgi:hypothetical protein